MKIIESASVRNIYLSLNYYCNNHCLMCGVPFRKHNMYDETIDFYIQQLKNIPFTIERDDIVTISGGEPFLFKGVWQIIEYVKKCLKCRVIIFTNGRALKNEMFVKRLEELEVDKIVIPFFSHNEDVYDELAGSNGAFSDVIEALLNLNHSTLCHEVKFLPMMQNYKEICDSYRYIKEKFRSTKFTICGVQYFGEAVNNVEKIGIKYVDLKEKIEFLLDFAEDSYKEEIELYRFPMCVLDAKYMKNGVLTLFQEYIIGPDYCDTFLSDEAKKKFKIPMECQKCVNTCDWYSKKYASIFGTDELSPIII